MDKKLTTRAITIGQILLVALLLCGAAPFTLGCGGDPAPDLARLPPAEALRQTFPAEAARVLHGSEPLAAAGDRFALPLGADPAAALGKRHGLSASLPRRGEDALRFHLLAGLDLQVKEADASGEGTLNEGVVAYPRKGGTSFWSATDEGFEEWLMLDAGATTSGEPAATWEVQGAALSETESGVELIAPDGSSPIRVTAPAAFAGGGRPVGARLSVRGARIELWVDAGGEPALVDPVWSATGSMSTARYAHTASLLASGKVLVAGGYGTSSYLAGAELYDPAAGTWSPAGSMITGRYLHTATVLASGKVLVTGGYGASGVLASAELYDPTANVWSSTTAVPVARYGHTATLLASGKVLVAGGYNTGYVAAAHLYDPTAGTWTAASAMNSGREYHTATLLQSGKVLVAGGYQSGALAGAELFNPSTNTWSPAGTMTVSRYVAAAVLLSNGKVLVTGGQSATYVASSDLYDPAANTWSAAAPMATARSQHTATLLSNGKVLVAGGSNSTTLLAAAEIYDAAANTWSAAGSMFAARYYQTATLLSNGKVLVAGGYNGAAMSSAELCDPAADSWAPAGSMTSGGRYYHTATLLPSGKVFVAGGYNTAALGTTQLYDPATVTWTAKAAMTTARYLHTATLLSNGNVLVAGGYGTAGYLTGAEIYNPSTNAWSAAGSLAQSRYLHTATLLASGKVLVTGGYGGAPRATAEIYDAATNAFTTVGSMSGARYGHTATLLASGKVLVAGGYGSAYLQSAELFDPGTSIWSAASSMAATRYAHTAALLTASGKVLVAGGYNGTTYLPSAELYDPAANTWTAAASMSTGRQFHTLSALPGGAWLAAGGNGAAGYLASAEVYDPVANTWSVTTPMSVARVYHASTSTLLASGAVLATGGYNSTGPLASAELYLPVLADDGNACTTDTWNATTHQLTHTPKPAGTPCPDGNLCNGNETCNGSGVCQAGTPVTCTAQDVCHDAGTCSPATGVCSNPNKPNGTACNDHNACTQTDTCQNGGCTGSNPVVCTPIDSCHGPGSCNPDLGVCSHPVKADGSACDDGNACTQTDACSSGVCTGSNPIVCSALDQCHVAGVCNAGSGVCSNPARADGSACNDGNACTQSDTCQSGACTGNNPIVCDAQDSCHTAGTCDTGTGACSNPALPDGTACSNISGGMCQAGACLKPAIDSWETSSVVNQFVIADSQLEPDNGCDSKPGMCPNVHRAAQGRDFVWGGDLHTATWNAANPSMIVGHYMPLNGIDDGELPRCNPSAPGVPNDCSVVPGYACVQIPADAAGHADPDNRRSQWWAGEYVCSPQGAPGTVCTSSAQCGPMPCACNFGPDGSGGCAPDPAGIVPAGFCLGACTNDVDCGPGACSCLIAENASKDGCVANPDPTKPAGICYMSPHSRQVAEFNYWHAVHPDWILYRSGDKVHYPADPNTPPDPAHLVDYVAWYDSGNIIPLDFTNEAVITEMLRRIRLWENFNGPSYTATYSALSLDVVFPANYYAVTGVFQNGVWTPRFSGNPGYLPADPTCATTGGYCDHQWRDAVVAWLARLRDEMHKDGLRLVVNMGYSGSTAPYPLIPASDPTLQTIFSIVDGVLDEGGFSRGGHNRQGPAPADACDSFSFDGPYTCANLGWSGASQSLWSDFSAPDGYLRSVQALGKPYYNKNGFLLLPGSTDLEPVEIEWALASHLLSKEHSASFYVDPSSGTGDPGTTEDYAQLQIAIGHPCETMQHVAGTETYTRMFSHGYVAANAGPNTAASTLITLPAGAAFFGWDSPSNPLAGHYDAPVGGTINVPYQTGRVLYTAAALCP